MRMGVLVGLGRFVCRGYFCDGVEVGEFVG